MSIQKATLLACCLALAIAVSAPITSGQTPKPELTEIPSQSDLARLATIFNEGNVLLGRGETQQAIQKYTEAIAISPSLAVPYVNRGVAYISLAKHTEALADADKALELLKNSSDPPAYSATAYQVNGTVYQNRGEYRLAADAYTKSIELVQTDAKFYNNRGNAYRMLKQYDAAMKDFNKAIELDPTIPMFYVNRASVHLKLKDPSTAVQDTDQALKLDKASDSAYYTRGHAQAELKKLPEALADYDQAIKLRPKSDYFHARARVHFMKGQFDLSIKDNTDAIAADPSNANAYGNRAVAYSRSGLDALAIEDIRKAIALKGDSALMRYSLAYFLYKTGQFAAAATEATKIMTMAPKWRDPYILRANCYLKLGNTVKAKADNAAGMKLSSADRPVDDIISFEFDIFVPEETDK